MSSPAVAVCLRRCRPNICYGDTSSKIGASFTRAVYGVAVCEDTVGRMSSRLVVSALNGLETMPSIMSRR